MNELSIILQNNVNLKTILLLSGGENGMAIWVSIYTLTITQYDPPPTYYFETSGLHG